MSSCFWHGWNVKSCSIFSNLPIVILHQQRQLKMSGSHLGVWKAFPGKPLMIQCNLWVGDGQSSWLWSQMHVLADMRFCCSSLFLRCLWWLPALPRPWETMGNRLDTYMRSHEQLSAQLLDPHSLSPAPKHRGVSSGRDWARTWIRLANWASLRPLLMCCWLCPSIPGVREFVPAKMAESFLQLSYHHMIHLLVSSHGDIPLGQFMAGFLWPFAAMLMVYFLYRWPSL